MQNGNQLHYFTILAIFSCVWAYIFNLDIGIPNIHADVLHFATIVNNSFLRLSKYFRSVTYSYKPCLTIISNGQRHTTLLLYKDVALISWTDPE